MRQRGAKRATRAPGIERLEHRVLLAATSPDGAVRIEAGATSSFTDSLGRTWGADTDYTGGTPSGGSYAVAGTSDDRLFYTRRWGSFSYNIPLSDDAYTLNLHFAEPTARKAGSRVFNVSVEGRPILSSFDLFATAGYHTALVRSFPVDVTGGVLNLTFAAIKDSPIISAIEIIPTTAPDEAPAAPIELAVAATSELTAELSWNHGSYPPASSFIIERHGPEDTGFKTVGSTAGQNFDDDGLEPGASYSYRVRASNVVGSSEPSDVAIVTTWQRLPAVWSDGDIGSVGQAGRAVTSGAGSFTVSGSGADIWNSVDAFHFTYQKMTGDGSIVARVLSQTNTNGWAKAGIMIRETASPDSRFALLALTPSNGLTFQSRAATHNSTSSTTSRAGGAGYWLKLTRAGTKLNGFISPNGSTWTALGAVNIPMPNSVLVGLAITAHDNAKLSKATFNQVSVSTTGDDSSIWSVGASDVMNRWESQNFTYDGKLYIFGGFIDRQLNVTDECNVYDPETDKWSYLTTIPVGGLTHAGVVVVGDVAYFAGGDIGRFTYGKTPTATAQVLTFNLKLRTWGAAPSLPAPVECGGLVCIDNVLYYYGGLNANNSSDLANTWALDLNDLDNGWSARAAMPNARNHIGYAAINGIAYAIGGQHLYKQTTGNDDDVHAYNPATNTWSKVASLPFGRGAIHTATIATNGKIIVVGGQHNGGYDGIYQDRVDVYDPITNQWTLAATLPEANEGMAVGYINGELIIVGGTVDNLGGWSTRQVWITDQIDLS